MQKINCSDGSLMGCPTISQTWATMSRDNKLCVVNMKIWEIQYTWMAIEFIKRVEVQTMQSFQKATE